MKNFIAKLERAFLLDSARITGYDQTDLYTVLSEKFLTEGIDKLRRYGFVVVELDKKFIETSANPREIVINFAMSVGVRTPHVPLHYNREEVGRLFPQPVATISPLPKSPHGEFDTNKAQGIHFDGTLEPMGTIRTAMLYCHRPAKEGGENTLYNIVGALYDLYHKDPSLVYHLFDPSALTKFSPKDVKFTQPGPVVAFNGDSRLITRFSNEYCLETKGLLIKQSLAQLIKRLAENVSPVRHTTIKLLGGQLLVLANNQMSHDRSAFSIDIPPRELYRAIFREDLPEL